MTAASEDIEVGGRRSVLDTFVQLLSEKCSTDDVEVVDVNGVQVLSLKTDKAFDAAQNMFADFDSGITPEGWPEGQQMYAAKLDSKGRINVRDCYEVRALDSLNGFYFLKEGQLEDLRRVGPEKKTKRMESLLNGWFAKNASRKDLSEQKDAEKALLGDYPSIVTVVSGLKPAAGFNRVEWTEDTIDFFEKLTYDFDDLEVYSYGEGAYMFYNPTAIRVMIADNEDIFSKLGIDTSTPIDDIVKNLLAHGDAYDGKNFGADVGKALGLLLGYDRTSVDVFPNAQNSPEFDFNIWGQQYIVHDPENNDHFKALKSGYDKIQAQIEDLLARDMSPMEALQALPAMIDTRIGTRGAVENVFKEGM